MQKIFAYIGVMVVGVVIGCLLPDYHFRDEVNIAQRDTIVRYDTIRYSRLELSSGTHKLDIPSIGGREYVFFDIERLDTVYRDNVQYIVYPREHFYTETEDVQIWHSGIDSKIDSLNVFRKRYDISTTITQERVKNWRFGLDLGVDVGKGYQPYIAPNLTAEIGFKKWSVTGEVGCSLDVQEHNVLVPALYYQVGLRYSLIQR